MGTEPIGCAAWREALSARLDGEAAPPGLDAHLTACRACTDWNTRLIRLHRATRVAPAGAVPDLTAAILAAAAADDARRWGLRRLGLRCDVSLVLRWVLVLIASLEIGMAAPEFSGRWHAGGELGTWAVASAVGLLSVAMKPARAGAVLPMLACASIITLVVSARDVVEGHALISAEWQHLLLLLGVTVILALWRLERAGDPPGPDVRVESHDGSLRQRARRAGRRAA